MKSPSDPAGEPGNARESGTSASPPSPGAAASPGPDKSEIVLASVSSSRAAERTIAHLGGSFRRKARRGQADAYVVTKDRHGSFLLTHSRTLTASNLVAAVLHVAASIMIGFNGILSALRGARSGTEAMRARHSGVGTGAEQVRELISQAGEHGAILVMRCPDDAIAREVEDHAAKSAIDHWRGSRSEFLAAVERRGSDYDWLRPAAGVPSSNGR